jgi:hypothetical protein
MRYADADSRPGIEDRNSGNRQSPRRAEGYTVIDSFNLPESAWWEDYYTPMLERMKILKVKNSGKAEAEAVYTEAETEVEMFRRHSKSYGYTFFILQRN